MRTVVYIHASRDTMYDEGVKLGLTGEALRMFSFACVEVKIELEVAPDGRADIMKVDDKELTWN